MISSFLAKFGNSDFEWFKRETRYMAERISLQILHRCNWHRVDENLILPFQFSINRISLIPGRH